MYNEEGIHMAVSYNGLWKLLIDKNMNKNNRYQNKNSHKNNYSGKNRGKKR